MDIRANLVRSSTIDPLDLIVGMLIEGGFTDEEITAGLKKFAASAEPAVSAFLSVEQATPHERGPSPN